MEHYWSLEGVSLKNAWVTVGSFDGVHRGHQEIIRKLTAGARKMGAPAVVLTFYPHPAAVLGRRQDPFYLTSPEERAALLHELGVDVVVTHPFTLELAQLTARQFMEYLVDHLGLQHLIVGYNFALGHGREGDVPTLGRIGQDLGYSVEAIGPVEVDGQVVSSSLIRGRLAEGEVVQAAALLGRPYQLSGEVVLGDGRGKSLGIPTANLSVWPERALPQAGVYACRAWVDGQSWAAVTNVGVRPTFEAQPVLPRVEAHLLDYSSDLYGRQIQLDFIARLRDEMRFASVQALVEQIHTDIARGREILRLEKSSYPS